MLEKHREQYSNSGNSMCKHLMEERHGEREAWRACVMAGVGGGLWQETPAGAGGLGSGLL